MKRGPSLIVAAAVAASGLAIVATAQILQARSNMQAAQAPMFEVDPLWPKPLPNRWLLGSAVGVAVDARDHVFVIHRRDSFNARTEIGSTTTPPTGDCCTPAPDILEFDANGTLVAHWGGPGQGYSWPTQNNRIGVDPRGNIWIGGSGGTDSHILKFSRDGKFLQQIGTVGSAAPAAAAATPPDTAYQGVGGRGAAAAGRGGAAGRAGGRGGAAPGLPPNSSATNAFGGVGKISFDAAANEVYVADGYRNRRVVVLDMETGAFKRMWGGTGNRPDDAAQPAFHPETARAAAQFRTPVHCAEPASDGTIYVCDRTNNRIQVFRKDGTFVKEMSVAPATRGEGSVWDIAFSRDPQQRFLYVADGSNMKIRILDRQSLQELTNFGDGGRQPGAFLAVHSIATDSRGNIYTTETYEGKRVQKFTFKGVGPVTKKEQGVLWPKK